MAHFKISERFMSRPIATRVATGSFWGKRGAKLALFGKQKALLPILCWFCGLSCATAQYSEARYPVWREFGVPFAKVDNYAGCPTNLSIDLYKPANADISRPLLLLLHGGIFADGQRNDAAMRYMAQSMASRGYVVASMDYREGWHLSSAPAATCPSTCWGARHTACHLRVADSAEVVRALYRAMQDAKSAIRFLKSRNRLDSTDCRRVFIGGHSFGGSAALMAAFLDQPTERPIETFALAPAPASPLDCNRYNPCGSTDRIRPDLGDVDGNLFTDAGFSSNVQGVLVFSGGLPRLDWLQNVQKPPVLYVFHQGCDHVVVNTGGPLYRPVNDCLQGCCPQPACQPLRAMPYLYGGDVLLDYLDGHPQLGIVRREDVVVNGRAISPQFGCSGGAGGIPFCSNPNYKPCHDLLYNENRMAYIATFLNAHMPPAACGGVSDVVEAKPKTMRVFPNPTQATVTVQTDWPLERLDLFDANGRLVLSDGVPQMPVTLAVGHLPAGVYFLKATGRGDVVWREVVVN